MEAGLRGQALAAAVTVAEFAKASPDPFADLEQPRRLAALHDATDHIIGLDALYLTRPGTAPLNLLDHRALAAPRVGPPPAAAEVLDTREDATGHPLITALAPAGKGATVVADIDSGYRFDHPDLADRAWTNEAEANGDPGVDDDGNGLVDDVHGYDWIGEDFDHRTADADPTDADPVNGGHGVHTAGIIGAAGDNGIGITGISQAS